MEKDREGRMEMGWERVDRKQLGAMLWRYKSLFTVR